MSVLLGAIADDFTGATDLQHLGAARDAHGPAIDVPPRGRSRRRRSGRHRAEEPDDPSRRRDREESSPGYGGRRAQILFKYCSTFDSTDAGNIGPVAEALMAALDTDFTLFCPAFPETGRTIYRGYLFVGDVLLSDRGCATTR
jgi:uncharacterized protein YgbK (DUF1537 family)